MNYQAPGSSNFLPSEIYVQNIEIDRTKQTITFEVPELAKVGSSKLALSAIASSSDVVSFTAAPSNVCTVSGTFLSFVGIGVCQVTAIQKGTSTFSPISVTRAISVTQGSIATKNIFCAKGSKRIKILSNRCPRGYKKS